LLSFLIFWYISFRFHQCIQSLPLLPGFTFIYFVVSHLQIEQGMLYLEHSADPAAIVGGNKRKENTMNSKKNLRRAALCIALALACLLTLPASAITPTYDNMTPAFRNSRYYLNLKALELTGDERTDIVMVAMSQLGYHEGNGPEHCDGESCGTGNYVDTTTTTARWISWATAY
jgi:hypothetical protein